MHERIRAPCHGRHHVPKMDARQSKKTHRFAQDAAEGSEGQDHGITRSPGEAFQDKVSPWVENGGILQGKRPTELRHGRLFGTNS